MPFNFSDTWSLMVMNCKPILSYTWASHLDIACITYKCFIYCMCVLIFLMSCAQKDTFPPQIHIYISCETIKNCQSLTQIIEDVKIGNSNDSQIYEGFL